jgi:hypothetical protein
LNCICFLLFSKNTNCIAQGGFDIKCIAQCETTYDPISYFAEMLFTPAMYVYSLKLYGDRNYQLLEHLYTIFIVPNYQQHCIIRIPDDMH